MLLGPLFGPTGPLLPAQILWVNLLTHGVPGVALGAEPGSPAFCAGHPAPRRSRCSALASAATCCSPAR